MRAYNVTIERSQDAIGWVGLLSIPSIGCITPPPFGTQCTLPRELALEACLRTRACTAITCPSQEPYERGQRAKKIAGPICQLRSRADTSNAEKRHGMCRPSGCVNVLMHPVQVDPAWRRTVAEAGASHRSVLLFVTASSPGLIPPLLSPSGSSRSRFVRVFGTPPASNTQVFVVDNIGRTERADASRHLSRRPRRSWR
uniref:Uncharacterized protein n=2 Tax=Chrysotila carterae TaxID=13221 RepID=A0A7S4B520_CHRCT